MKLRAIASLLLLAVGAAPGCATLEVWAGRDPFGREVLLLERGKKQRFSVGGVDGPEHELIAVSGLAFAPRGPRWAYPAKSAAGWHAVIDGVASPAYDGIGEIVFSPDGEQIAYAAEARGRWRVVCDGAEGQSWDALVRGTLGFGDDRRLSYAAWNAGQVHLVVEGRASHGWDALFELRRAPGSGRLAFLASRAGHCGLGTEEAPAPEALALDGCRGLQPSLHGPHWAFTAIRAGCRRLFLDGVEVPNSCGVQGKSVRFTSQGAQLAFVRRAHEGSWVVASGTEYGPFTWADTPVLATQADRWGLLVGSSGETLVLVDGQVRARHRAASDLLMSPDGRHLAYISSEGGKPSIIHDGAQVRHDKVLAGTLVLSADGRHWACIAGEAESQQTFVSVDGQLVKPFDFRELAALLARAGAAGSAMDHLKADLIRELHARFGNGD